jgi:hypothetical protein
MVNKNRKKNCALPGKYCDGSSYLSTRILRPLPELAAAAAAAAGEREGDGDGDGDISGELDIVGEGPLAIPVFDLTSILTLPAKLDPEDLGVKEVEGEAGDVGETGELHISKALPPLPILSSSIFCFKCCWLLLTDVFEEGEDEDEG